MTPESTSGEPESHDRSAGDSVDAQRRFGTFLIAVGVFGIIASILSAIGAIVFVAVMEEDLDASTEVTVDALTAAQNSVEVLRSVVATLDEQSGGLATALRDTADAVEQSRNVIDDTSQIVAEDVPTVLDSVGDVLPTLERAASSIDSALERLSTLPVGPDYDPDVPLGEAVADLQPALADLSSTLREAGGEMAETNESLANSPDQLRDAAAAIEELGADLDRTEMLVDDYEQTLSDAEVVAVDALDRVGGASDWIVVAIIALATAFALSQALPIWIGRRLRSGVHLVDTA